MHLRGQGALKGSSVGKACGDIYNHLTTLEKIVLEEKRGYCSDSVENHVNDNLKVCPKVKVITSVLSLGTITGGSWCVWFTARELWK